MAGVDRRRRAVAGLRAGWSAAALAVSLVLGGCSFGGFGPAGLSPTLEPAQVELVVGKRQRIMTALTVDMGIHPVTAADWYRVVEAGFSIVDDECKVYFSDLFSFDRNMRATRSTLNIFQQTANAILAVTGADTITMTSVAQAFGLASSMTDVVANTYLYRLPPASTKDFVFKLLRAYDNESSLNRAAITSPESAYRRIQGYLDLCLPVTIESNLLQHVDDMVATADAGKGGAALEVRMGSNNSALVLGELISDVGKPLPPPGPIENGRGLNDRERKLHSWQWADIQRAICAKVDGDPGPSTHDAIALFLEGYGEADPEVTTRGITDVQEDLLFKAVLEAKGQTCEQRRVADAREAGALMK